VEQKIPLPKEPTKFTYVSLMLPQIPALHVSSNSPYLSANLQEPSKRNKHITKHLEEKMECKKEPQEIFMICSNLLGPISG
jgi:hypothetical protein